MNVFYDFVFVILTYRNISDVQNMICSLERLESKYRVIIVNSHYDDISTSEFRQVAISNGCDFIDVPNMGYGAGNNRGIEFAMNSYRYSFLIVCNPDTEVINLDKIVRYKGTSSVIAPKIIRNDGRNQNPMRVKRPIISGWFSYYGFKLNCKILIMGAIAINKLSNIKVRKRTGKINIFAAHGSFVIFTYDAIRKLFPVYDEHMFLFCEEDDLGYRCIRENIEVIYDSFIEVRHYEDGSMNLANFDLQQSVKESFLWMWKKWH